MHHVCVYQCIYYQHKCYIGTVHYLYEIQYLHTHLLRTRCIPCYVMAPTAESITDVLNACIMKLLFNCEITDKLPKRTLMVRICTHIYRECCRYYADMSKTYLWRQLRDTSSVQNRDCKQSEKLIVSTILFDFHYGECNWQLVTLSILWKAQDNTYIVI